MTRALIALAFALVFCNGCSSYTTPGRGADMNVLGVRTAPSEVDRRLATDSSVQAALDKRPLAQFPTAVAVARVQAPGYRSMTAEGWGQGKYSVVTTRDVESDAQVDRLNRLPMVLGIAPLNRMLIRSDLQSDRELRQAAAQLHADVLLVYTLDTTFNDQDNAKPLSVITLGLAPVRQVRVVTTASAVLLDTRNGYVYGVAEATERQQSGTNLWQTDTTADATRRDTESKAFEKLVGELEKSWTGVVTRYAGGSRAPITVQ
jgi:hypothetical protein